MCLFCFLKIRIGVRVADMKVFQKGMSMDLPERTRKLYDLLKVEMENVLLELSVTKGGKQGESKLEVSNSYLSQRLKGFGREEGLEYLGFVKKTTMRA